jgi:hypothetical protein
MSQTDFSLRELTFAEYGETEEPDAPGERPMAPTRILCRGDERRLRAIVEKHFDFIWRSLRRLGVPVDSVDDAAQRVFWVAAKNLAQISVERERARSGLITNRSTTSPVAIPTATATGKPSHQLRPKSMTNLASSIAGSAPSWAWARLMNRFAL